MSFFRKQTTAPEAEIAKHIEIWGHLVENNEREEFVAYVKRQGIQTELAFDDKRTELRDHSGKVFTVRLRGVARTWPLGRMGEDAGFSAKEFDAIVTLVRCPRTEQTPNG